MSSTTHHPFSLSPEQRMLLARAVREIRNAAPYKECGRCAGITLQEWHEAVIATAIKAVLPAYKL